MGYPKQVYDRAWEQMERRKQQAAGRAVSRREEMRERIPEISRIHQQLAVTAAAIGKVIATDPSSAEKNIALLQEKNLALQAQRTALLESHGYPADYLAEQHGCALCRDTGYQGSTMCRCLSELLKKEAYALLGAVSQAKQCSFHNFSLDYYPSTPVDGSGVIPRGRMAQVLEVCRLYSAAFHKNADSLLMIGHTGLGKTHLSLAIATAVTEAGFGVVYTPVQKLMDKLESEKFSRTATSKEQYTDNLDWVLTCDLLVLDDLGTEFYTQFTGAVLYNIINSRLVEGRPTVISTNLELSQIEEKYSQRMVSRLICTYKVLKFYGRDIRFMKKQAEAGQ